MRLPEILHRLNNVKRSGDGYSARCPAHRDRLNSLSVRGGKGGKVLLYCHAGCAFGAITKALGLRGKNFTAFS